MSISTIFPFTTVKPTTARSLPLEAATAPAAPFTSAGRANSAKLANSSTEVGTYDHIWIEQHQQGVEVTTARRSVEGVDYLSLAIEIWVGNSARPLYSPTRAAGQLPGRGLGTAHDRSDLIEGDREHIVQNKGDPLGWTERLEHHLQGKPHRACQQQLLLRVELVNIVENRIRHAQAAGLLASGAQHVKAHAGDHCRQPGTQVLEACVVGTNQPQPRFLDGVIGFVQRTQYSVCHRSEMRAVQLKLPRQSLVVHQYIPLAGFVY